MISYISDMVQLMYMFVWKNRRTEHIAQSFFGRKVVKNMLQIYGEELEMEMYSLADETEYTEDEWGEVFDGVDA